MAITTTTTATTTIPEIWSALTADAREENLVTWALFDHRYEPEIQGRGDIVNIQGINLFSSGASNLGVGGTVTYEAGAFASTIQLTIDTHSFHAFDLEVEAAMMSNINLMEKLAGKSGYAVALAQDNVSAALYNNFGTNIIGTLATPLDEEDVRTAARMLDDAIAPTGDRFMVVSMIQKSHFEGQEKLVNADYSASTGSLNVNDRVRGTFHVGHGATWVSTGNTEGSNAAGHANAMFHRESVAVASIDNMRVVTDYNIDTDSDKRATHSIYGAIEVRDDHAVYLRGL